MEDDEVIVLGDSSSDEKERPYSVSDSSSPRSRYGLQSFYV